MTQLLMSPVIFVAATRAAGGPAAELFRAYLAKNEHVQYVMTPWLQQQVHDQLVAAGYEEATAQEQVEFISSLGRVAEDPSELGEYPMVTIAKRLELDTVYEASGRNGAVVDGVAFVPVHELMTYLESL